MYFTFYSFVVIVSVSCFCFLGGSNELLVYQVFWLAKFFPFLVFSLLDERKAVFVEFFTVTYGIAPATCYHRFKRKKNLCKFFAFGSIPVTSKYNFLIAWVNEFVNSWFQSITYILSATKRRNFTFTDITSWLYCGVQ